MIGDLLMNLGQIFGIMLEYGFELNLSLKINSLDESYLSLSYSIHCVESWVTETKGNLINHGIFRLGFVVLKRLHNFTSYLRNVYERAAWKACSLGSKFTCTHIFISKWIYIMMIIFRENSMYEEQFYIIKLTFITITVILIIIFN